ncbi:MAG: WG repeat-containing protein [Bacteroidota bacterium]|nr:WG repeat-containing protein [Bacteroidota bacterium]
MYNESLIPYKNNLDKWGYLDATSGQVTISAQYDQADFFKGHAAIVARENPHGGNLYSDRLYGLIDTTGNEILSLEFYQIDEVKTVSNLVLPDLYYCINASGWGIFQLDGQWLIAPGAFKEDNNGYPNFESYGPDHFLVNNSVFIDKGEKYKVPKGYRINKVDIENELFYISKNEFNTGVSDWKSNIIIPAVYLSIEFIPESNRFIASKDLVLSALTTQELDFLKYTDAKGKENLSTSDSKKLERLMELILDEEVESNKLEVHLLDEKGKEITQFNSTYFPIVEGTVIICEGDDYEKHNYLSIIDGKPIAPHKTKPGAWNVFSESGYYGLADPEGNIVLNPRYETIRFYNENCIIVSDPVGKNDWSKNLGIINIHQEIIVPFNYKQIDPMGDCSKFVVLGNGDGYGLIDAKGNTIIPRIYKGYLSFRDGLADVWDGRYKGVIDSLGREILPFSFNTIFNTKSLDETEAIYFSAEKEGKWGLFDQNGKQIIPVEYGYLSIDKDAFEKGWVKINNENRVFSGLINIYSGVKIEPKYTSLFVLEHSIKATNYQNDTYTYQLLDFNGKLISDTVYDNLDVLPNGYIIAKKDKKYGLLDGKGTIRLPFDYDYLYQRTPYFFQAKKNSQSFMVNIEGREYIAK